MIKKIAPSILSADFTDIGGAVSMVEKAGADVIHVDVMDGHFVPNITIGPQLVADLKKKTSLPLDVHLMVENPRNFIPLFHEAGADWISIHLEASVHLHKDISLIKEFGLKAGIALNPATPIHLLKEILNELDYILLMTVNPGWGGQKFIPACHEKISHLKSWISGRELDIPIEIDGGVKRDNLEEVLRDGADIIVVGSGIYKAPDPVSMLCEIKTTLEKFS